MIKDIIDTTNDAVVFFRLPNGKKKHFLSGKAKVLTAGLKDEYLHQDGFIIAPFSDENQVSVVVVKGFEKAYEAASQVEFQDVWNKVLDNSEPCFPEKETSKKEYLDHFEEMMSSLQNNEANKVILARQKVVDGIGQNQHLQLFDQLCDLYPNAFVHLVFTPQVGVWIGASPELLLKRTQEKFYTVALAGTIPNETSAQWQKKEIVEQQMVSDYILQIAQELGIDQLQVHGPQTIQAGQVQHLKTDFEFLASAFEGDLSDLINKLHPTPAVCGLPKEKAHQLIERVEKMSRSYYSGYLGPVSAHQLELYVNIRCMKLCGQKAVIYTGGGLTLDSVDEKEWQETELKAQTLLSVLKNIRNLQAYE